MRGKQVKEEAETGRKGSRFISEVKVGKERKGLQEKFRSLALSMISFSRW